MFFIKPGALLFIDSSNFYHSLKFQNDLPFDEKGYARLFKELSTYFEIKEINFYDAMKNIDKDPTGYAKQQRFHSNLTKVDSRVKIKTRKLRYATSISKEKSNKVAKEIGLQTSLRDKLYLFLKKLNVIKHSHEKGLDVLLIVDALKAHKEKKSDIILILSGDSDYVPAVEYMQGEGAKIINLHTLTGSSKELRDTCFEHILIDVDTTGKVSLAKSKNMAKRAT